jgi:hypothetical protein
MVWKLQVPPKVRIFVWRLINDGLATKQNKKTRKLAMTGTCQLCGMEDESAYHAVVRCPHAIKLRKEIRKEWKIPGEEELNWSGPLWLLLLSDRFDVATNSRLALLFWRTWFVRNEVVHNGRWIWVSGSIAFLQDYLQLMQNCHKPGYVIDTKGKSICTEQDYRGNENNLSNKPVTNTYAWTKPPQGWVKINVDGAFDAGSNRAGIGVIIRDENGAVLPTSWQVIHDEYSAEAVETKA